MNEPTRRMLDRTGLLTCKSMDAFYAFAGRILPKYREPHSNWAGGSFDAAFSRLKQGGSPDLQAPIRELMEKIDARLQDRERREYIRSPAGAFPVVAEVLQGDPMHMRRRQHVESDLAPVKIVCEVGVNAGVSLDAIARRGAAVAALAMRLGETRPVELWAMDGCRISMRSGFSYTVRDTAMMVRMETNPISISQLAAVFVDVGFARAIVLSVGRAQAELASHTIQFVWGEDPDNGARNKLVREVLGLKPEDLFIPGGSISEHDEYLRDPVRWITKYLDPQREIE